MASRWIPSLWRWKSRPRGGRPRTPDEIRQLIREMSVANPLWGAPRIHGELLKLGMDVGQTTVAKYMAKRRRPPSQGWRTFVHNHADAIASIDMFVVPTISCAPSGQRPAAASDRDRCPSWSPPPSSVLFPLIHSEKPYSSAIVMERAGQMACPSRQQKSPEPSSGSPACNRCAERPAESG
jgi:hypothetical protein